MSPRRAAAVLLATLLAGCGDPEPLWKQRTAAAWTERAWSLEPREAGEAYEALVGLAREKPEIVVAALEETLRRPPPPSVGARCVVALDVEEAARLGLEVPAGSAGVAKVLPALRNRLASLDLGPSSMRGTSTGEIEVTVPALRTRPELERVQAMLSARGSLEVRAVVRAPGTAGGGPVYDGATPWPDFLAAESRLVAQAREGNVPYRPSDPRWRLVSSAAGEVLVEEPRSPADAVDERIVASAEGLLARDGTAAVRIRVRPENAEGLARFLRRNAGGRMVVLADGAVRARQPVPAAEGAVLVLSVGEPPSGRDRLAWAREHAVLWGTGRLPLPLRAVPLPEDVLADPRPDNPIAKIAVAVGEPAEPMLRRIEEGGPPWAKASARWALAQLRRR